MENLNTKSTSSVELPSYRKPPVNEVVCGIRFHTPGELRIPHIGLLWNKFRTEYPGIQHAAPLATNKGEIRMDSETGLPIPRVWFINKSDDQLVQFQFDRFYFNWRLRKGDYPRYVYVIEQFESTINAIEAFFKEYDLGNLSPIEYELSYINHIPKGEGWDTIEDLPKIFADFIWARKDTRFLPNPINLAWTTEFPLQEKMGRLTVTLKQAIRTENKLPLFVLELNARGFHESEDIRAFRKWFDVAHEWIVRGFTDITTPYAHKIWERE